MKYDPSVYPTCTVPASDVQKVKGLGFLRDKTTSDCFNARVITRNGKITADEMYAIADAARRYGKGEVAFTTRQTVEVQGISFENIQPFCCITVDFLDAKEVFCQCFDIGKAEIVLSDKTSGRSHIVQFLRLAQAFRSSLRRVAECNTGNCNVLQVAF